MDRSAIDAFLAGETAEAGFPVLSEAKMLSLAETARRVVIAEDDRILGVGVIAEHRQADGSVHHGLETAVDRSMQFVEFERVCVEAALDLADGGPVSVWSMRRTLDEALALLGFEPVRTLLHMSVALPLGDPSVPIRALAADEVEALVILNNQAFHGHREAGSLTTTEFERIAAEPWFDPDGIVVTDDDRGLAAFCWTKVHPTGEGEIYRVAVRPDVQGSGLGRELTLAGFANLASRRHCETGTLWVDEMNRPAVELYRRLGLRTHRINREFERA